MVSSLSTYGHELPRTILLTAVAPKEVPVIEHILRGVCLAGVKLPDHGINVRAHSLKLAIGYLGNKSRQHGLYVVEPHVMGAESVVEEHSTEGPFAVEVVSHHL